MKKLLICILIICESGFIQSQTPILLPPDQDKGLPYTHSAKPMAIEKIKNHIAVFSGSRYAWVNGFKVRLDDVNWRDEAITKDGEVYVPLSFAAILSLKEIKTDIAPAYLKERWVYTIKRPAIVLNNVRKMEVNGRPYI